MNYELFTTSPIFKDCTALEIKEMLSCLQTKEKHFTKGSYVFQIGDRVSEMGLLIEGCITIESIDIWGNRHILDTLTKGQVFAETYACLSNEPLMVDVRTEQDCTILFINVQQLLSPAPKFCQYHTKLLKNLLSITASKNLMLSRHMMHITPKSIRDRLSSYLSFQAHYHASNCFTIPFNRQQLADYLNVERSALSNELSKMRKEGIISFHKNYFEIKTGL